MIHTASLLHDDVIDEAMTRRGVPSINAMFGNKFAILGGKLLLKRFQFSIRPMPCAMYGASLKWSVCTVLILCEYWMLHLVGSVR